MSFATRPLNSSSTLKKCTELYDPEDPSLDDDIDLTTDNVVGPDGAKENSDKGKTSTVSPARGVWLSVTATETIIDHSRSLKSAQGSEEAILSTVSSSVASTPVSCNNAQQLTTKTAANVLADQYLGHSMSFLVDLGKEMKPRSKMNAVDMFSCDDKGSSSNINSAGRDSLLSAKQSSYNLDSLLDSGSLSSPLAVPPIIWKSKRIRPSQILSAVADEDDDLAAEDRTRSLLGAPPIVTEKLTKLSSSVTSPPHFLKPRDDDESADSPPRIIPLDHADDGLTQPRHIRLSRENSPEEPAEDDLLNSNNSASEPPRIIRLEREDTPKPMPKPIKLCREDSLTELSDCNLFNSHDTPAEPPRLIRLNRDSSPKEEPRIIQLDRRRKPTPDQPKSKAASKNSVHSDEQGKSHKTSKTDSTKRSGHNSSIYQEDDSISGRNVKGKDKDQKQSTNRLSNKDEKKDGNSRNYVESTKEKYYSKAGERAREKSSRKRELSQDMHQSITCKSSRRDRSEDGRVSESESERHRTRKKKRQKSEDSNDKYRTKRKKKRHPSDDERHDEKHLQDRSHESRHHRADSAVGRDKSSSKRQSHHESKDKTSDLAVSSRASRRSDHERYHTEEVEQRLIESDHDAEVGKSSKRKKHRHSKVRTPESGHKRRRGSRSRSRKHKSKTRRRKHKRSRSRPRKQRKSRSASSTRGANSSSVSPTKDKHASSPERKRSTKSPDVSDAEDRDIGSHRRCSGPRSSRRYSEHNEKSVEEKENFVPLVTHSCHVGAHTDSHDTDDRKHSTKPVFGKDLDPERLSLSLLEVCMLTKYGPNYDASALRHAKLAAKNHSDDSNDIEILGVTYETELPQSAKRKSRRRKRRESGEIDSESDDDHSCCTVEDEDEPTSPGKGELQDNNLLSKEKSDTHHTTDIGDEKCVDFETKDDKNAQPCVETVVSLKAQVELENNVPATALSEDKTFSSVNASSKEVLLELQMMTDCSSQNAGVCDAAEHVLLDNSTQVCVKEADNQEATMTYLGSSVATSDHIPGICEDGFVVDADSKSAPAEAVEQLAESEKRLPEEFRSISSPEVEVESSRTANGTSSADLFVNYVVTVPLQRTNDTNTTSPVSIDYKCGVESANDQTQTQNDDDTTNVIRSVVVHSEVTSAIEGISSLKTDEVSADSLRQYPSTAISTSTSSVAAKISSPNIVSIKVNEASSSSVSAHFSRDYIRSPNSDSGHAAGGNGTCPSSNYSLAAENNCASATSVNNVLTYSTHNALAVNTCAGALNATTAPTLASCPPKLPPIIQSLCSTSSVLSVEELQRLSRFFQTPPSASSNLASNATNPLAATPADERTVAAPPPVSGNTMASRLLASLMSFSKTAPQVPVASALPMPVLPVPPAVPAGLKAGAIDFGDDDVVSPQSDEIMSFSPPSPTRNAAACKEKPKVTRDSATKKAQKKTDSKRAQNDGSSAMKHEKVQSDIITSCLKALVVGICFQHKISCLVCSG
jgi:hypothetical protein